MTEAVVCASCPETYHNRIAELCLRHQVQKAFGKAVYIERTKWKRLGSRREAKVVMATVIKAQTLKSNKALILGIAGGKNGEVEMAEETWEDGPADRQVYFIQSRLSEGEEERQGDKPSVVWNIEYLKSTKVDIEYLKSNMGWSHRGDGETWVNGPFSWVRDSINPWAAWTQTGTSLPNAIWLQDLLQGCWRNWPQWVDSDRKWRVSSRGIVQAVRILATPFIGSEGTPIWLRSHKRRGRR